MNTDFIILCGGQGTRLRETIGETQKVMASVGDEPFLDLLIRYIQKQGGRRVILSTGYKAEDVEAHYASGSFEETKVDFSREDVPLGTGGAIKKACGLVQTDRFFVLNGDSFCPADYKSILSFHKIHAAAATIAVSKVADGKDYGTIHLNGEGRVHAFQEKTASGAAYVNAGIYCFDRGIEKMMPTAEKFSIEKDFFPTMIDQSFYGCVIEQSFYDIGTPERYAQAQKYLK